MKTFRTIVRGLKVSLVPHGRREFVFEEHVLGSVRLLIQHRSLYRVLSASFPFVLLYVVGSVPHDFRYLSGTYRVRLVVEPDDRVLCDFQILSKGEIRSVVRVEKGAEKIRVGRPRCGYDDTIRDVDSDGPGDQGAGQQSHDACEHGPRFVVR